MAQLLSLSRSTQMIRSLWLLSGFNLNNVPESKAGSKTASMPRSAVLVCKSDLDVKRSYNWKATRRWFKVLFMDSLSSLGGKRQHLIELYAQFRFWASPYIACKRKQFPLVLGTCGYQDPLRYDPSRPPWSYTYTCMQNKPIIIITPTCGIIAMVSHPWVTSYLRGQ